MRSSYLLHFEPRTDDTAGRGVSTTLVDCAVGRTVTSESKWASRSTGRTARGNANLTNKEGRSRVSDDLGNDTRIGDSVEEFKPRTDGVSRRGGEDESITSGCVEKTQRT